MKTLALISLLAVLGTGAVFAKSPGQRVPVEVQLRGDDGLSRKLSASLQDGLRKHQDLRLANSPGEAVLTIYSPNHVGREKLGGRQVVIYTVYFGRGGTAGEPFTGICYEHDMSKCVRDILRIAKLEADDL